MLSFLPSKTAFDFGHFNNANKKTACVKLKRHKKVCFFSVILRLGNKYTVIYRLFLRLASVQAYFKRPFGLPADKVISVLPLLGRLHQPRFLLGECRTTDLSLFIAHLFKDLIYMLQKKMQIVKQNAPYFNCLKLFLTYLCLCLLFLPYFEFTADKVWCIITKPH